MILDAGSWMLDAGSSFLVKRISSWVTWVTWVDWVTWVFSSKN